MTDSGYTAVCLLVDRSGSMISIARDAEGGIAQFLEDQKGVPGKCTVRLCEFDNAYSVVWGSTLVAAAPPYRLVPRGSTALLDAWGRAMVEFGEELAALAEDERPGNVVFVVVTDGCENASREWTREQVLELVEQQTEKYGWQFLYLAAGQDAVAEGARYGVSAGNAMTYDATSAGTVAAYGAASASVTRTRTGGDGTLNQ